MDVYKGTGAFSGIAIGKILYYHKSEYQMRQYEITDVKTELNIFRQARTRVMEQLEDLYEKNKNSEEGLVYLFLNGVKEHNIKLKNPEVTLYMIIELVSSTCFNSILYNEPLPIEEFKPYLYELIRNLLKE